MANQERVVLVAEVRDEATADLDQINKSVEGTQRQIEDAGKKTEKSTGRMNTAFERFSTGGSKAFQRFSGGVRTNIDKGMGALGDLGKRLGESDSVFARFASAGISGLQSLGGVAGRVASGVGGIVSSAASAGASIVSNIGSALADGVSTAGKLAAAVGGIVVAEGMRGGIARAMNLEETEARLRGLGSSAEEIDGLMTNASDAIMGTSYRLDEAAGVAATFANAGVEAGDDMERMLSLVGDNAFAAGQSFEEMGNIWGRVAAYGKLDTQTMNQMMDRQIPILDGITDHYGITQDAAREMVTAGEIDFNEFADIMENVVGGAAQEMSTTTRGALTNVQAGLHMVGAEVAGPFMQLFRGAFNSMQEPLFAVAAGVTPIFEALTENTQGWADGAYAAGERVAESITATLAPLEDAADLLREGVPLFEALAEAFEVDPSSGLGGFLTNIGDTLREFSPVLGAAAGGVLALATQFGRFIPVIGRFLPVFNPLFGIIVGLIAGSSELREALVTAFSDIGEALLPAAAAIGDSMGGLAETLGPVIADLVTLIADGIVAAAPAIANAFTLIGEIIAQLLPVFGALLVALMPVVEWLGGALIWALEGAGTILESVVGWVTSFADSFEQAGGQVESSGIQGFFERLSIAAGDTNETAEASTGILGGLGDVFSTIVEVLPGLISGGLDILADVLGWIGDNMHIVLPLLGAAAAAFGAWKIASFGLNAAMAKTQAAQVALAPVYLANNLLRRSSIQLERQHAIATGVATKADFNRARGLGVKSAATGVAAGAQRGLNMAMRANPIGLIITGIMALVAGLVWFFTQTETGAAIFSTAWEWIQGAVSNVVDWFTDTALPMLQGFWDGIVSAAQSFWGFVEPIITGFADAFIWVAQLMMTIYLTVILVVWNLISGIITWAWETIISPILTAIGDAFTRVGEFFMFVWEELLQPVLQGLGDFFTWLWVEQIQPRLELMQLRWEVMVYHLKYYWERYLKPMLQAVGDFFVGVYNDYISPAVDWIMDRWDDLAGGLSSIWEENIKPALNKVGDFFTETIPGWVQSGVDIITGIWDTVTGVFATPINWVLEHVWNKGIVAAFNKAADTVGFSKRLKEVDPIGGGGGSSTSGRGGSNTRVSARAEGGPVSAGRPYLVGEEGPELITPNRYGWVHTAGETAAMASGGTDANPPRGIGAPAAVKAGMWMATSDNAVAEFGRDAAGNVISWVRGKLADAAEAFIGPIIEPMADKVSGWGLMGGLGGAFINHAWAEAMDWIRGQDEEAIAGGQYDGEFTANPGGFNRPAAGIITSRAGERAYQGAFGGMHYGVDIANSVGSIVRAAWAGVVKSTSGGGLNRTMVLNHGSYDTAYLHNSGFLATPGQEVTGGQPIARMGSAGTGPHLHFEVHPNGWYNPSIGAVNGLFDQGGVLPPGNTLATNNTGMPEYVLTNERFSQVEDALDYVSANLPMPSHHGGGGTGTATMDRRTTVTIENINIDAAGGDPTSPEVIDQLREAVQEIFEESARRDYR